MFQQPVYFLKVLYVLISVLCGCGYSKKDKELQSALEKNKELAKRLLKWVQVVLK